jgi:hypothetical protein
MGELSEQFKIGDIQREPHANAWGFFAAWASLRVSEVFRFSSRRSLGFKVFIEQREV